MKKKYYASQKLADQLMDIYEDSMLIRKKKYDQADCSICIMGNAINLGRFTGGELCLLPNAFHFERAIKSLDIPVERLSIHTSAVAGYLFSNVEGIRECAVELDLEYNRTTSALHARKRIETYLEASGYDIVWSR